MRNLIITAGLALIIIGLAGFKISSKAIPLQQETTGFPVPDDVKAVLDKSCLPCHGPDGNSKAKMKWNYEKMSEMKKSKQVSKLAKIVSKVEKGKMPTAKFVKKYPDRKLTEADKKLLIDWADSTAESLVN